MLGEVLGGAAPWPMTNVRNLGLPQWRRLAAEPQHRCLVPLTEFCEWTSDKHRVGDGPPIKDGMWFAVPDQPVFAIAEPSAATIAPPAASAWCLPSP